MPDFSDSAVVVYPSNFPIEEGAHCTLVYLGDHVSEEKFTREQIQSVLDNLDLVAPGEVDVAGTDMFGEEKDIPVAVLNSIRLRAQRKALEWALSSLDIEDASQFDFNPHVSLDPSYGETQKKVNLQDVPPKLYLEKPVLWWQGDESAR